MSAVKTFLNIENPTNDELLEAYAHLIKEREWHRKRFLVDIEPGSDSWRKEQVRLITDRINLISEQLEVLEDERAATKGQIRD